MLNRRTNVYCALPDEVSGGGKQKDAKGTISLNVVVPKEMEKKAVKFMEKYSKSFEKDFRKFIKKWIEENYD